MKKALVIASAVVALLAVPALVAAADSWLHVKVTEKGDKGSTVKVNLPLSVIEKAAPLAGQEWQKHATISSNHHGMNKTELKAMWEAVKETEDAEFVRVEDGDENVRVAKVKGNLVVHVDGSSKQETVRVEIPMSVADALLSGEGDDLDFVAAIEALKRHGSGQLVSVNDGDDTVRVWIDSKSSID